MNGRPSTAKVVWLCAYQFCRTRATEGRLCKAHAQLVARVDAALKSSGVRL